MMSSFESKCLSAGVKRSVAVDFDLLQDGNWTADAKRSPE